MSLNISFFLDIVLIFLRFLTFVIFARVILSWVAPHSQHPLVLFIYQTSEQVMAPIRRIIPSKSGSMAMFDWSPLLALILIGFLQRFLIANFA